MNAIESAIYHLDVYVVLCVDVEFCLLHYLDRGNQKRWTNVCITINLKRRVQDLLSTLRDL